MVVVRRHPLDTCLSNFRQLFALGLSYYDCACDLLDTGRYYLAFERNPTAVATASAVQVREPIHARAVGRWRRYERELAPLVRLLAEEGGPALAERWSA